MATKKSDKVFTSVKDGGERQQFEGGAVREPTTGKGRFDLIPSYPHRRLAVHYEVGSRKYADRNWEKGMPLSRCLDSAERHINDFKSGDRKEDHLAAAVWNLYAYLELEHQIQAGKLPEKFRDVPWPDSTEEVPE